MKIAGMLSFDIVVDDVDDVDDDDDDQVADVFEIRNPASCFQV